MIARCKEFEIRNQFLSKLLMGNGPPQMYFDTVCYCSRVYFKGDQSGGVGTCAIHSGILAVCIICTEKHEKSTFIIYKAFFWVHRGCSNWVMGRELITSHVQQLTFYGKLM
jgi:hypothetical protein